MGSAICLLRFTIKVPVYCNCLGCFASIHSFYKPIRPLLWNQCILHSSFLCSVLSLPDWKVPVSKNSIQLHDERPIPILILGLLLQAHRDRIIASIEPPPIHLSNLQKLCIPTDLHCHLPQCLLRDSFNRSNSTVDPALFGHCLDFRV